jgi:pyruvate,water dikinase
MDQPFILHLSDQRASLERVGGKGASLAKLSQAGLPVPDGFYITVEAYRRFIAQNELQESILRELEGAGHSLPEALEEASQRIRKRFEEAPIPEDIVHAITEAYTNLAGTSPAVAAGPAVAVRSSATAEDLPEASFAGQQETYLNVRGIEAVLEAVRKCWASLWTARAIAYRARQGIGDTEHRMPDQVALAVVVQLLVPAEAAGILFTADPVSGRRDQMVINAAWGLGEAIVGGLVTPDTLLVDRASRRVISRQTAEKSVMTVRTEAGTSEQPAPDSMRSEPVLDDREAMELAGLGEQIEGLYGTPMDIEWAWADGQFFILQARPVTALPPEPAAPLEWKLPDPRGKYMRASIIELMPDPLTPLFATLGRIEINKGYQRMAVELFNLPGFMHEEMVILINDYGYYDVNFTSRQMLGMMARVPFLLKKVLGTAETRWKDQSRPEYAESVARWKDRDLAALPAGELLEGVREILSVGIVHYIYSIQGGILPAAYMSETVFTGFYEKTVRKADDPPALTFMLGFDSLPIRSEKSLYDLAQWCRQRPELAAALVNSEAGQIAEWLDNDDGGTDWREFKALFSAHLEQFGHAIYDLDFAKPTPADDPAPLIETLKHLIQGQGSNPYIRQQEAAQRRLEAARRLEARLNGWKLRWFRRLLDWAQRYAPLREDALGDVGLGWPLLRRMLLELGRRFAAGGAISRGEDIFWLTETEVYELAAQSDGGETELPDKGQMVRERKTRLQAEKGHTPPPVLPQKSKWAGMDLEKWPPAKAGEQTGDVIHGIGASPGKVTAVARVLLGPEDFAQMKQGEVLVAAITTPAWTPLFTLASGVITDVGGPLSHSSIVAREYGIPAVLGTGVATRRITSGRLVTVDGDQGVVTIGEES